ncbi:hypothetical protein OPQ81_004810 [Rhizoctonia solani]|nr:hypothetical protein OPQ81_004810 [Rhizoctonia solani]
MGHGLGSDTDSELSSAPPSPRLVPSQWKNRPRAKRQPSTSVPNPPSSPKRRKRGEAGKQKDEKGKDGLKEIAGTKTRGGKALGKVKDPSPPIEQQASTSTLTVAAPAPWKRTAKVKVPVEPATPEISQVKPPPFAKALPKPKADAPSTIASKPPLNTSKSASPNPSKPGPSTAANLSPSTKPVRTTKRPVYNESTDSTDDEEQEKPKRYKRRKSHVQVSPKATRKPRPSLPAQPSPNKAKAKSKLEPELELRPASFLTKTSSFLTKPIVHLTNPSAQPREDIWSYDDLTGLTWVKLGIHKCEIVPGNERATVLGEQWCWWPAQVKQNTTNGLKLALCSLGIEREITPCAANETNVLTFRKPNISTVRFPTFKTAFSPPTTTDLESPPVPDETPVGETPEQSTGESTLPTSPAALETAWKQALSSAFKIDTESNDGLEDIYLLFSQKSKTPREEDELSGNTALGEQSEDEQEEDILENGTTVLCRYRTRYYPAKIVSYHPREGKFKRRSGKGRYKCVFADDSTRLATRFDIMTSLDDGFATCPLGTYQQYAYQKHQKPDQKPSGVREPSPAPRTHSPAPEPDDCTIDPEEYCSRERIRDQLKPVLPFLKGLIERRYIPGRGIVEASGVSNPLVEDAPPTPPDQTTKEDPNHPASVLDRHAIFMQGGRARKNLAYSVYTGDLNEDDCEELMFEISRWALRGERWACEGVGQEEESKEAANQGDGQGDGASRVVQESENTSQDVQETGNGQKAPDVGEAAEDGSSSQQIQENGGVVSGTEVPANGGDVDMEDATRETKEPMTTTDGQDPQAEAKSGDTAQIENQPLEGAKILEQKPPSTTRDFRSLVRLQPPRPIGAPDYEGLTPEERMGYVSDVLYPEAAALILSYRRGIRTQPGPLADPAAEHALYTAGLQAAKNTSSTSGWVEQILAIRQLRESNSKYHVEEPTQVVVSGGTKSRPKYMTSVLK